MNPADAAFVVRRVAELWPGCDWTAPIQEIFAEKISRYERDPVVKSIEEYRLVKTGRSPDPAALSHHIRERLRTPTDYGYKLPGYWNTIAAKMDMAGHTVEQVIKAYWLSFQSVWPKETLWLGLYRDARQWLAASADSAAWIADTTVVAMPECLAYINAIDADMERMMAQGRKKATEEMRRRLERKDKDVSTAFAEIRAVYPKPEAGGEEFDF